MNKPLTTINLPGVKLFKRGKVRDVFDLGDKLLLVSSDRISAFDSVLGSGIPDKGRILNQLSAFFFEFTKDIIENHMITIDVDSYPEELKKHKYIISGRSMLVRKAKMIEVECVVRGYVSGSGWKSYEKEGSICGIKLPEGLKESDKLPEPIFTPTTKASAGHDLPVTEEQMAKEIGEETTKFLKDKSIEVYKKVSEYAAGRGVIIADTKFEFGRVNDKILLIDEIFTPDSSRFWPASDYKPGGPQKSFDKQFVRDYLEEIKWNKEPPAPALPTDITAKTREKYLEAFKRLTGKELS